MKLGKFLLIVLIFLAPSFAIDKIYVFDIIFQGNSNITNIELGKLLRLQKKTFFSTSEFKINKLNLDLVTLQSYYKSKGYLDTKIDYSYDYINDNNVSITFIIYEGIQYKIGNISIMGNKSFEDSHILNLIKFDSDYYNPIHIRNKLVNLKNEYLKIGKINISINEEIAKEDSLVDLQVDISEGRVFYINNILISGLENIDKKLVIRELIFYEGDIYNIDKINQSKSHLFESQLFSSVEVFPYIESDSTIILDVRLRELRSREIEFEFGFSQLPSNQGDLPISAINLLGNVNRSNLFNSATKLSFRAEHGFSYSDDSKFLRGYYELGLYSPWFINIRIPFRIKIYNDNILFNTLELGDKRLGIIAYLENYRSSNPYLSSGLIAEFFQSNNSDNRTIYILYIKHNIKNFIQPLNGYYVSINPKLNGTFLGGAYNYLKTDIELKIFKNIFNNIVYATRIKSGFIYNIDNIYTGLEVPDFDKFFLGGSSSLRGWSSPLDYNSDIGGLSRILVNCEIRMPIYKIIGLELFYDAGTINLSDIKNDFHWNIGWGITILSSLGPARIDFAFKEGVGRHTMQISLLNMF